MNGQGALSVRQALSEQNPHVAEISDQCGVSASRPMHVNEVGQRRLSHSEREQAIELAELLEITFQAESRFIEAAHAAYLRQVLVAGRTT
jgi:hypothetical protein